MEGTTTPGLTGVFEMLVERLGKVEAALAMSAAREHELDDALPADSVIGSARYGVCLHKPYKLVKWYDGLLDVHQNLIVVETRDSRGDVELGSWAWCKGESRSPLDLAVEQVVGRAEADRIRGRCGELLPCSSASDCIKIEQVGVVADSPGRVLLFDWWRAQGLKRMIPELVQQSQRAMVLDLAVGSEEDCGTPAMRRVFEIVDRVRVAASFYPGRSVDVFYVPRELARLAAAMVIGAGSLSEGLECLPVQERAALRRKLVGYTALLRRKPGCYIDVDDIEL
jgi:hypothetical protein